MKFSRVTWRVLLAGFCFGATLWNSAARAEDAACPYVAEQNRVCPTPQDYLNEHLYDYELADLPESQAETNRQLIQNCPFRSIHDAIYDAAVYGIPMAAEEVCTKDAVAEEVSEDGTERITVVHTLGRQYVEVAACQPELAEVTIEAQPGVDSEDFYYEGESDLYDYDDYEYESYQYDYQYGSGIANTADNNQQPGSDIASTDQWDEYDTYDEYDYDRYYYENYEVAETPAPTSNENESESVSVEAEGAPMPYDEYGYDEYSMLESETTDDEVSVAELWGESVQEKVESQTTEASPEVATTEPVENRIDMEIIAQALSATGILPLASIVLDNVSLDELAAVLAKPNKRVEVAEATLCDDECGWADWDCYYEFEEQQAVPAVVSADPGNSIRFLERQALKFVAASMNRAGRTLQVVSDDLMRISGSEVAVKGPAQQLK